MSIHLRISRRQPTIPLVHFWSKCIGAGRAQEGLRANWLRQLNRAVQECGFRYLRFHGLFHDDMCVYREQDGKAIYNWQYIDELFDSLLEIGIRPFVELSFFPKAMVEENSRTIFWWKGCVTPPASFEKWGKLVHEFIQHCRQRYGQEEVRQWYFEVWNEPNLSHAFWNGTRSQYFELYRITAQTIKSIDSALRVGGPSTSNFVPDERFDGDREDVTKHTTHLMEDLGQGQWRAPWVEAFLDFCGQNKLPVDFISTHPYPTDFPLDTGGEYVARTRPVNSTQIDLQWLRHTIDNSAFPQAEIHLTEWSSSPSPRDHSHDSLPAAAFVVKANIESSGLVHSLSYWVFSDVFEESAAGDTVFHGGFGLINFQGILKPTYHAYRFLHQLGDKELGRTNGAIATYDTPSETVRILAYHYPAELREAVPLSTTSAEAEKILAIGQSIPLSIEIHDLAPHTSFIVEILDTRHGFMLPVWKEMGSPEPPTREQVRQLKSAAENLQKEFYTADAHGSFTYQREMAPWSIVSIREIH